MKHTITINQKRVVELKYDLDLKDCAILEWLFWFCNSKSLKIKRNENGKAMVLLDYIIQEMPLLQIKEEDSMSRRLVALEKKGFIEREISNYTETTMKDQAINWNRRLFVGTTNKLETLFFDDRDEYQVPILNEIGGGLKSRTVADEKSDNTNMNNLLPINIQNAEDNPLQNFVLNEEYRGLAERNYNLTQDEIDLVLIQFKNDPKYKLNPPTNPDKTFLNWLKNEYLDKTKREYQLQKAREIQDKLAESKTELIQKVHNQKLEKINNYQNKESEKPKANKHERPLMTIDRKDYDDEHKFLQDVFCWTETNKDYKVTVIK